MVMVNARRMMFLLLCGASSLFAQSSFMHEQYYDSWSFLVSPILSPLIPETRGHFRTRVMYSSVLDYLRPEAGIEKRTGAANLALFTQGIKRVPGGLRVGIADFETDYDLDRSVDEYSETESVRSTRGADIHGDFWAVPFIGKSGFSGTVFYRYDYLNRSDGLVYHEEYGNDDYETHREAHHDLTGHVRLRFITPFGYHLRFSGHLSVEQTKDDHAGKFEWLGDEDFAEVPRDKQSAADISIGISSSLKDSAQHGINIGYAKTVDKQRDGNLKTKTEKAKYWLEGYAARSYTTGTLSAYVGIDALLSTSRVYHRTFTDTSTDVGEITAQVQLPLVLRLKLSSWFTLFSGMQLDAVVEWENYDESFSNPLRRYGVDFRTTPFALHFAIDKVATITCIPIVSSSGLGAVNGEVRLFF